MKSKAFRFDKGRRLDYKKSQPSDVHIMNNNEARAMRKIKSETGLSESEIREVRKYRIILADARKEGTLQNEAKKALLPYRQYFRDLNWIVYRLKLPVWHEEVKKEFYKEHLQKDKINNQVNEERYEFLVKNFKVGKHL